MKTGDRIKMFKDSDRKAYMRLVASNGFRPRCEGSYVIVGEKYKEEVDKESIARSLLKARQKLKMDHGEFAALIGVSKVTVCNWERGFVTPDATNRKILKDLIGWEA